MNKYGVIRWRGECLPLTRRGRLLIDILSGLGVAAMVYGLIVVAALL